jgi:hypothetical protein
LDTTLAVTPRVAPSGADVMATGRCSGAARLTVTVRAAGWYDVPAVVVDVSPTPDSLGGWTASFPMPAVPSQVRAECTWSGGRDVVVVPVAPSAGDEPAAFPRADGDGYLVDLPNAVDLDMTEAFTAAGQRVELTVVSRGSTATVRISPAAGALRVVIIGTEFLGENAEARQVTRVQAWTVDIPAPPPTTTTTTSTTSTTSTTTTSTTTPATSTTVREVTVPPPPPSPPPDRVVVAPTPAPAQGVRLVDSRPGEPQGAVVVAKRRYGGEGDVLRFRVAGVAGVPGAGVGVVSLNVAVVDPGGPGYLTLFACGDRPFVSSLNHGAREVTSGAVLAQVSETGEVCVFSLVDTHLVIDLDGWFAA